MLSLEYPPRLLALCQRIFFVVIALTFLLPTTSFGIPNESKATKGTQNSKNKFLLTYLSPYSIANAPLDVEIYTENTTAPIKIELLKATSTRSDLFSFANNLGEQRVRDTLEVPFTSLVPSVSTPNIYSFQIPVNVYPVAISQENNGKLIKSQYSFVTSIPAVGTDGAAFSKRLQLLNFVKFNPEINRLGIIGSNSELNEKGKVIAKSLDSAKRTIASIANSDTPYSLLLNPDAIDGYNFVNMFRPPPANMSPFYPSDPLPSVEYIADTYVPVNLAELEKQGSRKIFPELLAKSRIALKKSKLETSETSLITQTLTQDSLSQIRDQGIGHVIVEDQTFKTDQRPTTKFASLKTGSKSLDIATYDTSIEDNIPEELSAASKANYLIAATSVVALEAPSNLRGFVLPLNLEKLEEKTVSQYLSFLAGSPLVEAKNSQDFFGEELLDKSISKKLEQGDFPRKTLTPMSKEQVNKTNRFNRASISMYEPGSIAHAQATWMQTAIYSRQDLGISKTINPKSAQKLVTAVDKKIELPEKRTLTITSRENDIPVTIKKKSSEKLRLKVNISSNRLLFPKGSSYTIELDEENTTIKIPVKARTSGSFPISIQVNSPSESILIAEQTATVRSTALSGTGVIIALGSALFLALWWAYHYKKSRRKPLAPIVNMQKEGSV